MIDPKIAIQIQAANEAEAAEARREVFVESVAGAVGVALENLPVFKTIRLTGHAEGIFDVNAVTITIKAPASVEVFEFKVGVDWWLSVAEAITELRQRQAELEAENTPAAFAEVGEDDEPAEATG